jgi:hypothetical protein
MHCTYLRPATAVKLGLVLVQLAFAGHAMADDAATAAAKMFTVSGFGTLGVVNNSSKTGDYVADVFQATGAGNSHDYAISVDSKVALQVDARITDQLTAVVQLVSRTRTNNTYSPGFEWANIKYAITPELSVRVGRTALPVFLNSETRLVGYANPWVRPPIETYSLRSTTNADGVDMAWSRQIAGVNNNLQAWYGKTKIDSVGSTGAISRGVEAHKIIGVADTVQYGSLTVRAGVTAIDFILHATPTTLVYAKANVYNVGAVYDPGNWFVQGEATKTDFGAIQRAQQAFYATLGYRWEKFTPYVTYSTVKVDDDQVKLAVRAQHSTSAGVRWDLIKNVDIKLQLDQVALAANSTGFFTNAKPGLAGGTAKVISLAVDFVY